MTHHTDAELLPCPFCCAGITSIRENGMMWTGQRYSEPTSVSVMHHCEPVDGQPSRAIERVGRDMESAVAAWNSRAPAAPVPQGVVEPIETVKYWRDAYANPQGDEHFMGHGMVVKIFDDYLGMLAAAPQPPEAQASVSNGTLAAPVQLPDPAAWMFKDRTWTEIRAMAVDHDGVPAYTEQQVRELLANHGIQEQST